MGKRERKQAGCPLVSLIRFLPGASTKNAFYTFSYLSLSLPLPHQHGSRYMSYYEISLCHLQNARFIGIVRIVRALLTRLAIKCDISGHYRSCGFYPSSVPSRTAIGEIRAEHAEPGDSAVTRSMDSVHGIMISSDTRIYVRSARCTYPDTIGGV